VDVVNEFNKCPPVDQELKDWSNFYPKIKEMAFDSSVPLKEFACFLANLKENMQPADKKGTPDIEYNFQEEKIIIASGIYKGNTHNPEQIRKIIQDAREYELKERSYINNTVRDWKDYDVPNGDNGDYRINGAGIFLITKSIDEKNGEYVYATKDVCRSTFVICGVSEPINGDSLYYKVRYVIYNGDIREFWASQSDLLSRKELKTLFLSKGINCPENSILTETIDYISRSIAEFGHGLKKEFSAKRNGWNSDKSVFVLGNRAITEKGIVPILSVGGGKGFPDLDKIGTVDGWVDGVSSLLKYDVMRFKCYDALTAVLKAPLGIESHATDHYGNTSSGKTFTAQVSLSMIGDAKGLTIGATSTMKGILVHVRDYSDLPILIDESSDAKEHLADLVYTLTSNKGRVKSTVDGQRDGGEEYHTTAMFTGEQPIRDCLLNSGQQYRVNELDDTLPDLVTTEIARVERAIRDNHGHIIELYLQTVFTMINDGTLEVIYDQCFNKLPDNTSNIEGRSKSIFACIMTSGYILEDIFKKIGIPNKNAYEIVNKYFEKCIIEKPVELESIRALRVVMDWIHSDFGRFTNVEMVEDTCRPEDGGGLSKYMGENKKVEFSSHNDKNKRYGYVDIDYIDIIGAEFTKKMKDEGFSPSKLKEDWWNQGIVDGNDAARKGTCRFTHGGKTIAGVRIIRRVAEELIGVALVGFRKDDICQNEKIYLIRDTIKFLTDKKGEADLNLIRLITEISDLDDLLNILSINGKVMKTSQTSYKSVY